MNKPIILDQKAQQRFDRLCADYQLSPLQQQQMLQFLAHFMASNEQFNLTAITNVAECIEYHLRDSLELAKSLNLTDYTGIADIGTGGGFPGIPLKILYPQLPMVLIEVNRKKIAYLNEVITALGFENSSVYGLDWRTFLRKTTYPINLFLARASLHTDELLRIFKPSSPYKDALLVYWASQTWEPTAEEKPFVSNIYDYAVGHKKRKYVFFKRF